MPKIKKPKLVSELRQDLVSGDWVVVAKGRAFRPGAFHVEAGFLKQSKKDCPFEDPEKSNKTKAIFTLKKPKQKDWFVMVIPNKYPAVVKRGIYQYERRHGPFTYLDGVGFHELVITRDHSRHPYDFIPDEMGLLLKAYIKRYQQLEEEEEVEYISIFYNYGPSAGASIPHPHSQILAIPVIPPDISNSIRGSREYFEKHAKCVHCAMISWEKEHQKRIIFENKEFIAFTPFVSRSNFEVRIFPKVHSSCFTCITEPQIKHLSEVMINILKRINVGLKNPPLNFFLHSTPAKTDHFFDYYHWHIEILPKLSIYAGFELSTGIDIVVIDPDEAAKILRESRIKK